ncbi:AraC family transcriptional regulator [Phaeobacter porticola]|uniref:Transcription regulator, AraC family n=1 Tax=Phaeobacter porticola TaxID=1844006 RepID=A0A1L3I6U1_9RHOB|nr:AraC family transcriptional regulator [Phaeobacter porticola]APG47864.1 transcription regulator, AraC family [Phaeobacter porticola]
MSDVISDLLNMMRVRGTANICKNIRPPWGMQVDQAGNLSRSHLILSGSTWIELTDTQTRAQLQAGDFVLVLNGRAHLLTDRPSGTPPTRHAILALNIPPSFESAATGQHQTQLLCGYFQITQSAPPALTDRLRDLLIMRRGSDTEAARTRLTIEMLTQELNLAKPFTLAILDRLTETLSFCAMRHWLRSAMAPGEALHALADTKLQTALIAFHADPVAAWTVAEQARVSGQSRTAFATHFKAATGLSPIAYVSRWRIEMARRLLADSDGRWIKLPNTLAMVTPTPLVGPPSGHQDPRPVAFVAGHAADRLTPGGSRETL